MNNISVVTPEEFFAKVSNAVSVLISSMGSFIVALATLALIMCVIIILVGSILHSKQLRLMGFQSLGFIVLGSLIFLAAPLIVGLLKYFGQILQPK